MGRLIDSFKAYITDDASAVTGDILTGKTAYVNGGKVVGDGSNIYRPAMMKYDGSSNYRIAAAGALSGNVFSIIARVKAAAAVAANAYIFVDAAGGGSARLGLIAQTGGVPALLAYQSDATQLISQGFASVDLDDLEEHVLLVAFNATTGAYVLYDKHTAMGSGTATTGTLGTSSAAMTVGSWHDGVQAKAPANFQIGAVGYIRSYIDWSVEANRLKFMTADGRLKAIDESGWTEFGAQHQMVSLWKRAATEWVVIGGA